MHKRIASFAYALTGIGTLLRTQANARIHAVATVLVIALGAYCGLASSEWIAVIGAIALVWMAEGLNTAIEFLADATRADPHPLIRHAKDVAAGAVLIAAIAAATIGLLVFGPRFMLN